MEINPALPQTHPPFSTPGNIRLYPRERTLFRLLGFFSLLFWLALILISKGSLLPVLGALLMSIMFMQSSLAAYLQGNAVKIGISQFPDLHARLVACCIIAGVRQPPHFYLMAGDGVLNAFAARFLNRYFVVLLSNVVDALEDDEEALNFYIGHELGHISQRHLISNLWISVMSLTPLLGAAYSRACEYTCDQYGLACCSSTNSAVRALTVLAVGGNCARKMNVDAFVQQGNVGNGHESLWLAANELNDGYPWLCKRVARVRHGDQVIFPRRSFTAYFLSLSLPRPNYGFFGSAVFLCLAAVVALPFLLSYMEEQKNAEIEAVMAHAYAVATDAAKQVDVFSEKRGRMPASLQETGFQLAKKTGVQSVEIGARDSMLTVKLAPPHEALLLYLTPVLQQDEMIWVCSAGGQVAVELLPEPCRPGQDGGADT